MSIINIIREEEPELLPVLAGPWCVGGVSERSSSSVVLLVCVLCLFGAVFVRGGEWRVGYVVRSAKGGIGYAC